MTISHRSYLPQGGRGPLWLFAGMEIKMSEQVQLLGMVLSSLPIGEYDKRLVILTKDRGKISAFAKGARRQNSALLACSQPFAFGNFALYEGRTSYNVKSAEIIQYFTELQTDWEAVCYSSYLAEYADYYTRENVEAADILKLLYQSLRALAKGTIDKALVRYIYELRMYLCNGEAPEMFSCVRCHKSQVEEGWEPRLHMKKGGLICPDCLHKLQKQENIEKLPPVVGEAELYAMRYILTAPLEKLYTFRLSDEAECGFASIMDWYRQVYVPHTFHSLENLF